MCKETLYLASECLLAEMVHVSDYSNDLEERIHVLLSEGVKPTSISSLYDSLESYRSKVQCLKNAHDEIQKEIFLA